MMLVALCCLLGLAPDSRIVAGPLADEARKALSHTDIEAYKQLLSVPKGGQLHHAIELQVLDRFPGVFSDEELNSFKNFRGIVPEDEVLVRQGSRAWQKRGENYLHLGNIRADWNQIYRNIEEEVKDLDPKSSRYKQLVRSRLTNGRDFIDWKYNQSFSENRYRPVTRSRRVVAIRQPLSVKKLVKGPAIGLGLSIIQTAMVEAIKQASSVEHGTREDGSVFLDRESLEDATLGITYSLRGIRADRRLIRDAMAEHTGHVLKETAPRAIIRRSIPPREIDRALQDLIDDNDAVLDSLYQGLEGIDAHLAKEEMLLEHAWGVKAMIPVIVVGVDLGSIDAWQAFGLITEIYAYERRLLLTLNEAHALKRELEEAIESVNRASNMLVDLWWKEVGDQRVEMFRNALKVAAQRGISTQIADLSSSNEASRSLEQRIKEAEDRERAYQWLQANRPDEVTTGNVDDSGSLWGEAPTDEGSESQERDRPGAQLPGRTSDERAQTIGPFEDTTDTRPDEAESVTESLFGLPAALPDRFEVRRREMSAIEAASIQNLESFETTVADRIGTIQAEMQTALQREAAMARRDEELRRSREALERQIRDLERRNEAQAARDAERQTARQREEQERERQQRESDERRRQEEQRLAVEEERERTARQQRELVEQRLALEEERERTARQQRELVEQRERARREAEARRREAEEAEAIRKKIEEERQARVRERREQAQRTSERQDTIQVRCKEVPGIVGVDCRE